MTNFAKIPILFEDDSLIVIYKPFGLIVNRAESVKELTIQDWVEKNYELKITNYEREKDFKDRSGVVHRLDKETSGCLIIAKNPVSFLILQELFKSHQVKKTYIALVHGILIADSGEINVPIGRLPWNREMHGVIPGGKEAFTRFKRITNYVMSSGPLRGGPSVASRQELRIKNKQEKFTLVEVNPETGRTHQIRVHLKYLGFPIVGDYLYGGRKTQKADRLWCPRVFLHAAKISFPHPDTRKEITCQAPIPDDLKLILEKLTPIS